MGALEQKDQMEKARRDEDKGGKMNIIKEKENMLSGRLSFWK